jgi:hypothetical protein
MLRRSAGAFVTLVFGTSCTLLCGQRVVDCQLREVVVNVRDTAGTFVADLKPASFQATIGHQTARVISDRAVKSGARVILVLDLIGSMQSHLAAEKFAAEHFVANLSGVVRVAMVTFSDHILETIDFTQSPREMLAYVSGIKDVAGHALLDDSLSYSVGLFGQPQPGDAIYVVTDGGDNGSKSNEGSLGRLLNSKGVRLFWFELYDRYFATEEERRGTADMKELTERSGGLVVTTDDYTKDPHSFEALVGQLYGSLKNFYLLSLEIPSGADDKGSWNVEVVDEGGKKRKGIRVFQPKHLPSCVAAH